MNVEHCEASVSKNYILLLILLFCSQLFQNSDNRTTYTVQRREIVQFLNNTLRYPLVENMDYVVRVRNISCVCVSVADLEF